MLPSSVARSYARALVETAPREERAALGAELDELARAVAERPELLAALASPVVPAPRRVALARELLESVGASRRLQALVLLLVQQGHARGLAAVAREYARAAAEAQGVTWAQVRVARPVGEVETDAIRAALAGAVGGPVELEVTVDAALLGGFVARAGDLVFDGSLRRQLERLRADLARG